VRFEWAAILDHPGVNEGEIVVYIALLAHRNERTGVCNPSLGALARRLRIDRRTVMRRLDGLEAKGAIKRRRHSAQRQPAEYELLVWADSSVPPTRGAGAPSDDGQLGARVSLPRGTGAPSTRGAAVTQLGAPVPPEHAKGTRELNTRRNTRAVSANSSRTASRAEEEAALTAIIEAVRERRSPPLSRDQAREARKIARDRLRAGWSSEQIAGALVETAAFTTAAVDFVSRAKRGGSSAAQRSAQVLNESIRDER
jgi:hypothetical protein